MIAAQPKTVSHVIFALHLLLFLAATVFDDNLTQPDTAAWLIGGILFTWAIDFFSGGTLWIPARPVILVIGLLYLLLLAVTSDAAYRTSPFSFFTIVILIIALSSDAITNSRRWKLLLAAYTLAIIYNYFFQPQLINVSPDVPPWAIPVIPVLAILARGIFPHTKHLIHTSLDYRFARIEILSMGMKRVAAVGIRRNKAAPLP